MIHQQDIDEWIPFIFAHAHGNGIHMEACIIYVQWGKWLLIAVSCFEMLYSMFLPLMFDIEKVAFVPSPGFLKHLETTDSMLNISTLRK